MSIRLGEDETESVISHLERIDMELDAVRKILSGRFEIKKKKTRRSEGLKDGDNGAIQLDLDVSGIQFKQKAGAVAGPHAKWGWIFAYPQGGGYHPESERLVQALEQYGSVQIGNRTYSLGGTDGNLLNFKES